MFSIPRRIRLKKALALISLSWSRNTAAELKYSITITMKSIHKNQNPFGPLFHEIVAERQATHYRRMRNAIWLYLYLMICANPKTGKLTACVSDIAASEN
jgi:hypothetical protein